MVLGQRGGQSGIVGGKKECIFNYIEWIIPPKCSHADCSQSICAHTCAYRVLWTFLHQLPVARLFFSCSASIILQPWRYEKQEAIFSVKWVEARVHSLIQTQISRTSSDVCHIEGGIKARCLWYRWAGLTLHWGSIREIKIRITRKNNTIYHVKQWIKPSLSGLAKRSQ